MGQKTNPNILRLGVTKKWKTEFFEKSQKELPLYVFKDLEIQDYIERFFEINNILIQDYKQHYSNKTLNIYISYFVNSTNYSNLSLKQQKILLFNSKKLTKIVSVNNNVFTSPNGSFFNNKKLINKSFILNNFKSLYLIKNYLKNNVYNFPVFYFGKIQHSLKQMVTVINEFTNHQFDIIIHLSCINKDFTHLTVFKNKKIKLLQKFKTTSFFKEGLELLFHVVFNKSSSSLLGKFIAIQMKTIKRPNFFLAFLKRTLTVLMSSKMSKIKGVKILLKGRLSKGPRAKHKILTIGDVAVQSFTSNLDYFQTTTHNSNGSYGIKVWVIEK